MIALRIPTTVFSLALLTLTACSGGSQIVEGTLDLASFPETPDAITAVALDGGQATSAVDADGHFTLRLAPATSYRLSFASDGTVIYSNAQGMGWALNTGMPGEAFDLGDVRWISDDGEKEAFDAGEFCTWADELAHAVCADEATWDAYWVDPENGAWDDWSVYSWDEVCNGWLAGKLDWCAADDKTALAQNDPGACIGDCDCTDGDKVQQGGEQYYCYEGVWHHNTYSDKGGDYGAYGDYGDYDKGGN